MSNASEMTETAYTPRTVEITVGDDPLRIVVVDSNGHRAAQHFLYAVDYGGLAYFKGGPGVCDDSPRTGIAKSSD